MHAVADVTAPGRGEGFCAEIQKIERHFEEEDQSANLRQLGGSRAAAWPGP